METNRLILWVVLLGVLGTGWAAAHEDGDVSETRYMHMTREGYEPANLIVKVGDTVVFENKDTTDLWPASNIHPTHSIYSEFDPKQPLSPGGSWSFEFERPGDWRYHDHLYPQVVGTITVSGEAGAGVEVEKFSADLVYDEAIEVGDEDIFNDNTALYSHVRKYGAATTTEQLEVLEETYGDCHDTAHWAGRFAYELYDTAAFKQCGARCHSGCYHGAIEGFFHLSGTVDLQAALQTICRSQESPFEIYQCLHGIGHGLMAWTDYDLPAALAKCDLLEEHEDFCYTGVLMENLVGGLAGIPGHETRYLSEDPFYPCNALEERYKATCYTGQTSYMRILYDEDVEKIAETCKQAPDEYQLHCFQSLGRDLASLYRSKPAGVEAGCGYAPSDKARRQCIFGAASELFWEPEEMENIVGLCNHLTVRADKRTCYHLLYERAPQVYSSWSETSQICKEVDRPWRPGCRAFTRVMTDYYNVYGYLKILNLIGG